MLPLKNRIKKGKDFRCVFDRGRFIDSDLISVRFLANRMDDTRVGFIVSKKVSKTAALRNKVKRMLREIMRANIAGIKEGFDIIITAKSKISKTQPEEIDKTLKELLKRSNLIK